MTMTPEELYPVLDRYARSQGLQLNQDKELVLGILEGLLENERRYGYRSCPCRLASGVREEDKDIICPCVYSRPDIAEYGRCYCALYVLAAWNEDKIEKAPVPERRPPRRKPAVS
jgi:ferredoxin-thioredoxin reductase catalytic subunit